MRIIHCAVLTMSMVGLFIPSNVHSEQNLYEYLITKGKPSHKKWEIDLTITRLTPPVAGKSFAWRTKRDEACLHEQHGNAEMKEDNFILRFNGASDMVITLKGSNKIGEMPTGDTPANGEVVFGLVEDNCPKIGSWMRIK